MTEAPPPTVMIRVTRNTRARLKAARLTRRETYDDTIRRILAEWELFVPPADKEGT